MSSRVLPPHSRGEPKWRLGVGIAATLLAGIVLWVSPPAKTLASEVITHIEDEPGSLSQTRPVADVEVESIAQESGLVLTPVVALAPVVYVRSCDFRGQRVAHLVVMTQSGPVTIIVFAHERVRAIEHFESDGYRGVLAPVEGGSVAVVSRSDIALERTASDVLHGFELASSRGEATRWNPR